MALQLGLQQLFMPAQLGAWGLRVLFVINDVAALGALCLRTHTGETAAFEQRQQGLIVPADVKGERRASSTGQIRLLLRLLAYTSSDAWVAGGAAHRGALRG